MTVTLPTGGSSIPVTGSDAPASVVCGLATLFPSGTVDLSTQGTLAGGSETASATRSSIPDNNGETMTAASLSSTWTANGANSASTTVADGVGATVIDSNGNMTVTEVVPATRAPALRINGTVVLSATDNET